jgi:hypothetical protein
MIKPLIEELTDSPSNELIFSPFSLYPALCFRGTETFVARMSNFVVNFSLIKKGKIYNYNQGNTKYVLSPQDRILHGLKQSYCAEIILNNTLYPSIKYKFEVIDGEKDEENAQFILTWDEAEVESLASNLAINFWEKYIKKQNMFQNYDSHSINDGELNFGRTEEQSRITEI